MRLSLRLSLALFLTSTLAASGEPVSGKSVDLKASDGTKLAGTYYPSDRPGPGILLFHQCNRERSTWNALAAELATKGFHVLTLDYRGYGQSGGKPYTEQTFAERGAAGDKWYGDVDVAFAYLRSQPGVRGDVIGAGGASCGVNQSIQLARRHPEVKSLVLLSGATDAEGRKFLKSAPKLPLFLASADDDGGAVEIMAWIDASSGNPANQFIEYKTGGHGTDMFSPHPKLPSEIVSWYEATLLGKGSVVPASKRTRPAFGPRVSLLVLLDEPGGPARAADQLAAERKKDPNSKALEEGFVNQLGYAAITAGDPKAAVAIQKMNTDAHPQSANAWDSLGDAYLADGQRAKALEASEKALALLPSDKSVTEQDQRTAIQQSAQGKIDQLKNAPAPR